MKFLAPFNLSITNPSEVYQLLCQKYWEFNGVYHFKYRVQDLSSALRTTVPKITSIVEKNSCLISLCQVCGCEIARHKNRNELNTLPYQKGKIALCSYCETEKRMEIEHYFLAKATEAKRWKGLSYFELQTLRQISTSSSKKQILFVLFKEINFSSEEGMKMWGILNVLENKNLIWIERDENNSVLNFHVHKDLHIHLSSE